MKYKDNICKNIFRGYDIRGIYPTEIDADTAYTIGLGFGSYIRELGKTTCIVGHDNRLSSPVLYEALIQGILSTGIDIIALGLCTTPMYYYACIKLKIYSGVMVTASHNPKDDNGFKFAFDESGNCKGQEIQDFLDYILRGEFQKGEGKLRTYNIEPDYLELFKNNLAFGSRRVKVVIDPGNGTTSVIAKRLYEMFPMDLIVINGESDGHFPNHHPDPCVEDNLVGLKQKVLEVGADIGLGFDGDGDRCIAVDAAGNIVDGDKIMYICGKYMDSKGLLKKDTVVTTVMSNLGMYKALEAHGMKSVKTKVGDRYVVEEMLKSGYNLGGEQSGHIIFLDHNTTGDGMLTALQLLSVVKESGKTLAELASDVTTYPQELLNIKVADKGAAMQNDKLRAVIDEVETAMAGNGRVLVRPSGTEPLLRIMAEAPTKELVHQYVEKIGDVARAELEVE